MPRETEANGSDSEDTEFTYGSANRKSQGVTQARSPSVKLRDQEGSTMLSTDSITGGNDTLMRDSPLVVTEYIRDLKEAMGEEWINANPQSLALLVQAAAITMHGSAISKEISRLTEAVVTLTSRL